MICTNLSTLYDILYRLTEDLDKAIDIEYHPGD